MKEMQIVIYLHLGRYTSCVSRHSFFDHCALYTRSYYTSCWCDLYNSFDHDI